MNGRDEARLNNLEMKFAHQEKTIAELNEIVTEQWRKIELLERQLQHLRDEMESVGVQREGEEPPPPHY